MFDNFNVNLRKNEGFLTYIPCIRSIEITLSEPIRKLETQYPRSNI